MKTKPKWPSGRETIRRVAKRTDTVMLSISRGKDSLAMWLECRPYFKRIVPVHFQFLPGLHFVEDYLRYLEDRMQTEIVRALDPRAIGYMRSLILQSPESSAAIWNHKFPPHYDYRKVSRKIASEMNLAAGTWFGNGIKAADSPLRSFVLYKHGPMNRQHREFRPVWDLKTKDVAAVIRKSGIKLPVDYRLFGRSWENLNHKFIDPVRQNFPRDWRRIRKFFPMVDAERARYKLAERRSMNYTQKVWQSFQELERKIDKARKKRGRQFKAGAYHQQLIKDVVDSEWWFAVCFHNRAQKEAFLKAVWPDVFQEADKYIDGLDLAERLGVCLPPSRLPSPKAKINPTLASLSMTVKEARQLGKEGRQVAH